MRVIAVALLVVLPLVAADEDPTEVLLRLREQVLAHGKWIPNHTCVETVERDRYEPAVSPVPKTCDALVARRTLVNFPAMLRLAATDRLRLDVALAEGREIYSWAGASKFEDGEIDELIPDGAMGTGPFAALVLSAFEGRVPKFTYEGETTLEHHLVFEYSFHVPVEDSHYRVKAGREWLVTGYTGTLWADIKTAELVRLQVRTDELPAATTLCETVSTLDYSPVHLGKDDYLLPKTTRQRFIGRDGFEADNSVAFSACREYRGESTLTFGGSDRAIGEPGQRNATPAADFPIGLPVAIELSGAIRSDRSAAGDRIEGRLAKAIRDRQGTVLAPEGALLEGRLMRVEVRHGKGAETVVSLRWETLELHGEKLRIALLPSRKITDLKIGERVGLRQRGVEIELPAASDTRHGVYRFPGEHAVIEGGYRTEWSTASH